MPQNKMNEDLFKIRHSAAHILAYAIRELFPGVKIAIGPVIENGFYYDFDFDQADLSLLEKIGEKSISEKLFPIIEKKMQEIIAKNLPFKQSWANIEEAKKIFKDEPYKIEIINEIAEGKRDDFGKKGQVSLYTVGSFTDLCKGPHVKSTEEIKAFKLLSIAGAYWKGEEKNKMLTRIYGTAFKTEAELNEYLKNLEEAKKRDHRILGKKLDLFTFSSLVGPGLPLWTPKGTIIRELLDSFVWSLRKKYGYQRVEIPHVTKKELYETSGHWEKFKDELFKIKTREGNLFALKPMNCPHHTQIFNRKPHSYREMPQRYANTTMVYRDEQSGELLGLSRVISITQDDAHVFCRKNQVEQEFEIIWNIVDEFYSAFNLPLRVRLSFHDPKNKAAYLGDEKIWKNAETALENIAKKRKADYFIAIGEAAFYGPKLDFITKDSLNREWQVATIQLDMNMPNRFGLYCINEKGEKEEIVMIHAAIMGSIERFFSLLLEHTAGNLPFWLSPTQVAVLPVSEKTLSYAEKIKKELEDTGLRVELNSRNQTLSEKIRQTQEEKIPVMVILGKEEEKNQTIAIRLRNGKQKNKLHINNLKAILLEANQNKKFEINI